MDVLKKYRSFTVIETIIALVLTMICVGIAFTIMLNTEKSGNTFKKMQTHLSLLKELNETKKEKKYLDENKEIESIKFVKTVTQYQGIENLFQVKITAFDNDGKKLDEVRELIIIDE